MAKIEQIIPLSGQMIDTIDSESMASDKGLVRKRINVRPDINGSVFANVPVPGTVLKATDVPAGINKTLGWCNDNENEAIIWMVWNENENHCIFRYFTLTKTVQKIFFEEPTLGFTDNTNITAEVIDGRLYWNDNTDQPKGFNIQKAVNYTAGLTENAYTSDDFPLNEKVFPFCKKPPKFKPEITYQTVTEIDGNEIDFNNLRKKQWQAKYCFVYEDFQESVYSPISFVPEATGELSNTGYWVTEITKNNALKITVETGSHNVKQIKVAIRDASVRNEGSFYTFITIDKFIDGEEVILSDTIYDTLFLNNTYLESIDNPYGNAYFHNVPLSARDTLLIDGKYIGMSMPKYGYDFDEKNLNYQLDYVSSQTEFTTALTSMKSTYEKSRDSVLNPWEQCGYKGWGRTIINITVPDKFEPNAIYRVTFKTPDVFVGFPFSKQPDVVATYNSPATKPANYPAVARDALLLSLHNQIDKCFSIPINIRKGSGDGVIRFDFYHQPFYNQVNPDWIVWWGLWEPWLKNYSQHIYGNVVVASSTPVYKGLKKGQYHPFAIVYNDSFGRYNIAFGDKKLFIPVPDDTVSGREQTNVYNPKITISSVPPIWAETYSIAYIPDNSYTYHIYVPAVNVITGGIEGNGVETGYYFLKINQSILSQIESFPDTIIEAYVWQKGDRLRQVGKPDSYEILREFTRNYIDGVEEKVETGYLVKGSLTLDGDMVPLIEIYRPNLNPQDKIFYETGDKFNILDAGTATRRHEGNVTSQSTDYATSAVSVLDFGDVYFRLRFAPDIDEGFALVEDNNYSDYYISSGINLGRGVVRTRSKQEVLKRIVKTENYLQNTEFNRLNIMLAGDEYYEVSEDYGDIYGVIERGDTLKIYQGHRETSIYIGKIYAKDASGGDVSYASDKVFGSPQPYAEFLGCTYPRAIRAMGKYVYFFDLMTADFCRSATNGTVSISKEFGYDRYFNAKAEAFRQYDGTKDIVVGCEPNLEIAYISFIMGTSIETIAFSEADSNKGFLFFAEFNNGNIIPDNFAHYGDYMYSFVNGRIYEHGNGAANSFYGSVRKNGTIEFIANQYPQLRKTFEVIALDTNGTWNAEMTIEPDDNYPTGQKTQILSGMFKSREGFKTSGVPRNLISQNGTEDFQRLYSGNKMSGNSMNVSIVSSNFDILRKVKVISINQE